VQSGSRLKTEPRFQSRLIASALTTLILAVSAATASAPAEGQEQPRSDIAIEITQLSPLAPTIDSVIRISGNITNKGSQSLEGLSLSLQVGQPLAGRSEIASTFSAESSRASRPVAITNMNTPTSIAANRSGSFSLTTTARALGFAAPGVYPVSVSVSPPEGSSTRSNLAIPYYPLEQSRLKVVGIWPLLSAPAQIGDDVAFTQALPNQFVSDGSLANMLAATRSGFNILADPSVLNFAKQAQAGYVVSDGRASQVGTNSPQIKDWWTKFDAVSRTNSTWLTGFANPVTWAPKGNRISELRESTYDFAEAELSEFNAQGLLAVVNQKFDSESIGFLSKQNVSIIMSSRLVPLVDQVNYTSSAHVSPSSIGLSGVSTPILVSDDQVTGLFEPLEEDKGSSDSAVALRVRQQIASDLTLIALERPSTETLIVVVPPSGWSPGKQLAQSAARAIADGPWAELVPLKNAFDQRLDETLRQNASPEQTRKNQGLRPRQVELLKQSQDRLEKMASVIQLPSLELSELEVALSRGLSFSWVAQPKLGRELTSAVNSKIESKFQNIAVITSPELTLTGRLGALPVTINNDLDAPIRVNLGANVPAGTSIDLSASQDLVVEAKQVTSVDIPIEVQANINAPIELYLENSEGQRVGGSAVISIRTTAYSQVAQWISIAALVLLVIFAGVSITKKITKARRMKA